MIWHFFLLRSSSFLISLLVFLPFVFFMKFRCSFWLLLFIISSRFSPNAEADMCFILSSTGLIGSVFYFYWDEDWISFKWTMQLYVAKWKHGTIAYTIFNLYNLIWWRWWSFDILLTCSWSFPFLCGYTITIQTWKNHLDTNCIISSMRRTIRNEKKNCGYALLKTIKY